VNATDELRTLSYRLSRSNAPRNNAQRVCVNGALALVVAATAYRSRSVDRPIAADTPMRSLAVRDACVHGSCERSTDYVTVRDGVDKDSPVLATYCGSVSTTPAAVTSSADTLSVELVSDEKKQRQGFAAQFSFVTPGAGEDPLLLVPPSGGLVVDVAANTTRPQHAGTRRSRFFSEKKQVGVQLPTPADNATLLAFAAGRRPCSNRSISRGRRAQGSKPAAAACAGRMMGQTDRQTDVRTLNSFIDPAPRTMRAVPITSKCQ